MAKHSLPNTAYDSVRFLCFFVIFEIVAKRASKQLRELHRVDYDVILKFRDVLWLLFVVLEIAELPKPYGGLRHGTEYT